MGQLPTVLAGLKMVQTASIYRLSRISGYQKPIELMIDLLPGITPLRVTFDMIDSEDVTQTYTVTDNSLQDFSTISSNVHKDLVRFSISGFMSSGLELGGPLSIASLPTSFLRFDLLRIENLRTIADRMEPVMVVTPRFALNQCFIESISAPWTPELGPNTEVSISCKEARLARPGQIDAIPDYASQTPGNSTPTGGGGIAGAVSNSPELPSGVPGVSPF